MIALVKLGAITALWFVLSKEPKLILEPIIIRTAIAAETAQDPIQNETNATTAEATKEQPTDPMARERELNRREAELHALELELDEKLQNLQTLERKMQKLIDAASVLQDEKMEHLVDVYANMKPKQAAQVLETLDPNISVKILAGMNGRKAGEILSSVRADIAAYLSEALTRLQTEGDGS
jgi:flagellar motility protein MotE (MotC chaperone)